MLISALWVVHPVPGGDYRDGADAGLTYRLSASHLCDDYEKKKQRTQHHLPVQYGKLSENRGEPGRTGVEEASAGGRANISGGRVNIPDSLFSRPHALI